ncbi:MAG: type IV pilin biogenesis protein [Myxococcales bacterium FL481]|nr:MAG: type IV pilin biogenesis protein [Myxococcales bacterium FL481]
MATRNRPWVAGRLAAVLLLAAATGLVAMSGQARLEPYYIVRGEPFAGLRPRVLFVVDSSASMALAGRGETACEWSRCEGEASPDRSRIHTARQAIHNAVVATRTRVDVGLMTFDHLPPPDRASLVPARCQTAVDGGPSPARFAWVTQQRVGSGPGNESVHPIPNPAGGTGTWALCGDKRAYPYLRWDDLLHGYATTNGAPMPAGPLARHVANEAFADGRNATRRVQWMPHYMGPRFHLEDCQGDAAQQSLVDRSFGDYGDGADPEGRAAHVCGHDFYSWPYVDGFPGYAAMDVVDDAGTDSVRAGFHDRARDMAASLLAPFYLPTALDDGQIRLGEKGPRSRADAVSRMLSLSSATTHGGIDVQGNTPWSAAIGDVSDHVIRWNNGALGEVDVRWSNGEFKHDTVASYLSFLAIDSKADVCVPTVAVLVAGSEPSPGFGGSTLHANLSRLRRVLGIKTYVVGLDEPSPAVLAMACAAAGSRNASQPCLESDNEFGWDTCRDADAPATDCAFVAEDEASLTHVIKHIVGETLDTVVPSGSGSVLNEYVADKAVRTHLTAHTEIPTFRGHVERRACSEDEEYCRRANEPPQTLEREAFDGGGTTADGTTHCPLSRTWDAGECLQRRRWETRKLYSNTADDVVYRISDPDGTASERFVSELAELGLVDSGPDASATDQADAVAAFVLGADFHGGWKLPGLANSNPVVVRRIPRPDPARWPQIGVPDPNCAGRRLTHTDRAPASLAAFAREAWRLQDATGPREAHYNYQEAVLVGDDLGVLHAFQLDSGNELFGFLPRAMLSHLADLAARGAASFGQPQDLAQHQLGMSSTVTQGWAYDHERRAWRHLAVVGMGGAAAQYLVLDVSHMGRVDADDPFTLLWTTSGADHPGFEAGLGEAWSHPALTYVVPNNAMQREPQALLVFGSGYRRGPGEVEGRTLFAVDAVTGRLAPGHAIRFPPPDTDTFDAPDDYALVNDPAVGTHCLSRFWAEAQETYLADTAGRLFRWDLGANVAGTEFLHAADSGALWTEEAGAQPLAWGDNNRRGDGPYTVFRACEGTGQRCRIRASNRGEPFVHAPAVVANNRIDEIADADDATRVDRDQLLLALVSGAMTDNAISGEDGDAALHPSLYVLVDDHREHPRGGLRIPGSGGFVEAGAHPAFARYPISEIWRERKWTYPDGTRGSNVRRFSRLARPVKPPRIRVTGLVDREGVVVDDAEAHYISFTVFEPGQQSCSEHWFDPERGEWQRDPGSVFEVTFRLVSFGDFDLRAGDELPGVYRDGFGPRRGLSEPRVRQLVGPQCPHGLCGGQTAPVGNRPCVPKGATGAGGGQPRSLAVGWAELDGFSPVELPLPN